MTPSDTPADTPSDTLSHADVLALGLADWHRLAQALHARFVVDGLDHAARLVSAVAELTATDPDRPRVRVSATAVDVELATRVDGVWVTAADVALARAVSAAAADLGARPDPTAVTQVELGLDTADRARTAPFWSALLTGSTANAVGDSVFDPTGALPAVWFQDTDPHDVPRQRWHLDIWLAPDAVAGRIAAAVAAGGTVVDDSRPSFTVLADPDGNRACLCSSTGRD